MNSFLVQGKRSKANYTLTAQYMPETGQFPCYATPLFDDDEAFYAFSLVKWLVFPDAVSGKNIHSYKIVLVTTSQLWVGCIGVAEFEDPDPSADDLDRLLDVQSSFSLLSPKANQYPESYWKQCIVKTEKESAHEPAQPPAAQPKFVFTTKREKPEFRIYEWRPARTPISFSFSGDEQQCFDFYPIQAAAAAVERFYWKGDSFLSVFHCFVECLHPTMGKRSISTTSALRRSLDSKVLAFVEAEWVKQSVDEHSLLWQIRFARWMQTTVGQKLVSEIPWGTPFQFVSLDLKDCLVTFCVDELLLNPVYDHETADGERVRAYCESMQLPVSVADIREFVFGRSEERVWVLYSDIFFKPTPSLENEHFEREWMELVWLPSLHKLRFPTTTYQRVSLSDAQRRDCKRQMVRHLLTGEISVSTGK